MTTKNVLVLGTSKQHTEIQSQNTESPESSQWLSSWQDLKLPRTQISGDVSERDSRLRQSHSLHWDSRPNKQEKVINTHLSASWLGIPCNWLSHASAFLPYGLCLLDLWIEITPYFLDWFLSGLQEKQLLMHWPGHSVDKWPVRSFLKGNNS